MTRIPHCLTGSAIALSLSAGPVAAASPQAVASVQPVTRVAQSQAPTDQPAHGQQAQAVSDALGQRLDQMMLGSKPASHQ